MNGKEIGATLRALRVEKGKTPAEMAAELDISVSAISMYENGERVPRDNIKIRIANYFEKTVAEIFFAIQ